MPSTGSVRGRYVVVSLGKHCLSPALPLSDLVARGRSEKEGVMRTKVTVLLATIWAIGTAAAASASGPAPPGKELIQLNCDRLGAITVSVQRGANANGAGQIVDSQGHGIPVTATLTLTDTTSSTVLAIETTATGQGNAHANQTATHCTGVLFEGSASDFFGGDLPPGVPPAHTVQLAFDGFAVIKQ